MKSMPARPNLQKFFVLTLLYICTSSSFAKSNPNTMNYEEYWKQISDSHQGIKAIEIGLEGKQLKQDEANLMFRPNFFAETLYSDDSRPSSASLFTGTSNTVTSWKTGVSELLPSGTQLKLSYGSSKTEAQGANPLYLPVPEYYDVGPSIELSQALWRNFLGKENRSQSEIVIAQIESQMAQDRYALKNYQNLAFGAFWRLYCAQQSLTVMQESYLWAKKLRDWNAQRVAKNLADEIDLLQSESNLKTRELELHATKIEYGQALRSFNQLRQQDGDVSLLIDENHKGQRLLQLALPKRAADRDDLVAAQKSFQALIASAQVNIEKNLPSLDLYASYGRYGRDAKYSEAQDEAFAGDHELGVIGIKFVAPLDIFSSANARKGNYLEQQSAEQSIARKQFDLDQEWKDLSERFADLKEKLSISIKMQEVQTKKLEREKDRYNRGRTTTFQVLQFGQDSASARLNTIRNELELISTYNQLKLFEE